MPFAKSTASSLEPASHLPVVPETVEMLAHRIAHETSLVRRSQCLNTLVTIDTPAAAAALAGLLAHVDAAARASGVDGLRRVSPAVARPVLAALLADVSADIRIRALDAIERQPDPEIEGWLIALLKREDEANVCAVVLDLLAEMGTPAALPAIRMARLRFANEHFIAFAADLAQTQITEG